MKMKIFAAIGFIGCTVAGVVLAMRDSNKKEKEVNDLVTETINAIKTEGTHEDEYRESLRDSKERTIMAINEIAELLNKLDPCSEDYANLVDRQKELLVVLDRFIDEEQKINGLNNSKDEEQRRLEEGKRQFKRDLIKIFASGGVSLLCIYLIEAFQAGGWIIKSPAMQWIPKPKI